MRHRLLLGLSIVSALGCGEAPPPSVLLLTVDTLRPDYLSANGYDRPTTPRLDALLAEAWVFEHALTPVARTTPALASLLTGSYPHTTGVRTLTDPLSERAVPLAVRMRDAGYASFAVVTNDVVPAKRGLARGFDVYRHFRNGKRAAHTTEVALSLLADLPADRPFFAWVHYLDPHVPYHPTGDLAERFDPDYEGPYPRRFGQIPDARSPRYRPFPPELSKGKATHTNTLPDEVNAHLRRLYAADIRDTDDAIGPLLDAARARAGGELLVVFTADHGESLGEHDFYFDHGDYVYDASLRVPLAFVLPTSHPWHGAGRCGAWASLVDVLPTVLELLGLSEAEGEGLAVEGRSLAGCFRGEALDERPVFAESGRAWYPELVRGRKRFDVDGRFRSVTLADWKLIFAPFAKQGEAWQLYDLSEDPSEERDLFREDHPRVPALRAALSEWLARAGTPSEPAPLDPDDAEALRALGYAE